MPSFETTRRLPYTPTQMFDLVSDIENYPRFFPMCDGMRIRTRQWSADREILVAAMDIGYKAIRETITTRVTLDRPAMKVDVAFVDGPFSRLENRWQFTEASDGATTVHFFIAYEFKSLVLQMLVGALFDTAFRRCVSAFEERARQVYGTGRPGSAALTTA